MSQLPTSGPVQKACACLVDARGRLLVFRHPVDGDLQLPKGTVEPGESPERAVRRELLEESGIDYHGPLQPLGTLARAVRPGRAGQPMRPAQLWHIYLMHLTPGAEPLPEQFKHQATGSPAEEGLVFEFHWLELDAPPLAFAQPFQQAIARVRKALAGDAAR